MPRTPRLNGNVERSHRVDVEEFDRLHEGLVINDDDKAFSYKPREWEDYFNCHRPHGDLGGQTPYERLKQRTTANAVVKVIEGHAHLDGLNSKQ
ncbi:integrase core domain-containing protein [Streptomyces nigra]|uniref:integrase core domain-containing protein n=1 Tax=Streptomyces nigra TaxID=1827580 RepID=UPI0036AB32C7